MRYLEITMPRTEWETLSDRPCQGILMVTLPQCRFSKDQALSRFYCQKQNHVLKKKKKNNLLSAKESVPAASFRIDRLPGIPTSPCFLSLCQDRPWDKCLFQYECELSFFDTRLQYLWERTWASEARRNQRVRAKLSTLLTSDRRRAFKLSSDLLCSVIWPASVAVTVKTRAGLGFVLFCFS